MFRSLEGGCVAGWLGAITFVGPTTNISQLWFECRTVIPGFVSCVGFAHSFV